MVLGGPGSYFWQGMLDILTNCMKIRKSNPPNVLRSLFSKPILLFGPSSGQVISAAKEDIIKAYYPGYFMQSVEGQIQTKQVHSAYDDSYQGKTWCSFSR